MSWVRSKDVWSSLSWGKDASGAGSKEPCVHHVMATGSSRWQEAVFTQVSNSSPFLGFL